MQRELPRLRSSSLARDSPTPSTPIHHQLPSPSISVDPDSYPTTTLYQNHPGALQLHHTISGINDEDRPWPRPPVSLKEYLLNIVMYPFMSGVAQGVGMGMGAWIFHSLRNWRFSFNSGKAITSTPVSA